MKKPTVTREDPDNARDRERAIAKRERIRRLYKVDYSDKFKADQGVDPDPAPKGPPTDPIPPKATTKSLFGGW